MGHRVTAIGHDPILGLVFGTANIATATLTNNRFESYHIGTNLNHRDYFKANANTGLVLSKTADKLLNQGINSTSCKVYVEGYSKLYDEDVRITFYYEEDGDSYEVTLQSVELLDSGESYSDIFSLALIWATFY